MVVTRVYYSFIWWCYVYLILCYLCSLVVVSVHVEEKTHCPVFTGCIQQVKTCWVLVLMGLFLELCQVQLEQGHVAATEAAAWSVVGGTVTRYTDRCDSFWVLRRASTGLLGGFLGRLVLDWYCT